MRFAFFPEFLGHIRHVVKIAQVMLKKNLKVVQKTIIFLICVHSWKILPVTPLPSTCQSCSIISFHQPVTAINNMVTFRGNASSRLYGDGLVESRHSLYVCSSEWETHFCIDLWEFISLLAS